MTACEVHEKWNEIELRIAQPAQFYNLLDPAPNDEKEINQVTESYIMDSLDDMQNDKRGSAKIVLYLEQTLYDDEKTRKDMEKAIHSHFAERVCSATLKYKQAMNKGRRYLIRGLIFLIICLIFSSVVTSIHNQNDIIYAIGQSFVIIGWVALWRPVEFYLYDRRDMIDERKMLSQLETIPIDTRRWDKQT
ncbi:hypothetical protein Mlab_1578 [Methanocorpusculum labreanum Z]|uniref:2TM domain-containing protein n=1 Tax=Methanocorpusculum labreanum (strain ATCC 43576 / DSM 4855 / Z) TaxID=410358 RepID=A2STT6_METLZ|nr:hypothetical protein [Methanocorpusculum labreanum]ABN07742.1 hypothetical protein Mlab_1578 [Methanocorpusculum labreanum Z]